MVLVHSIEALLDEHSEFIRRCVSRVSWAVRIHGIPREDLEVEAQIGFMEACRCYDPAKAGGAKFTSYAYRFVMGAIQDFIRRSLPIRVSAEQYRIAGKILSGKLRQLPPQEIAEQVGCTVPMAERSLTYLSVRTDSLNQPFPGREDGELQDVLEGPDDPSTAEVNQFIGDLMPNESTVLKYRMQGYRDLEILDLCKLSEPQLQALLSSLQRKAVSYFQIQQGGEAVMQASREEFIKLKGTGMSDKTVAKQFKIGLSSLGRMKKEWGLIGQAEPSHKRPVSAAVSVAEREPTDSAGVAAMRKKLDELERENAALKVLVKMYL